MTPDELRDAIVDLAMVHGGEVNREGLRAIRADVTLLVDRVRADLALAARVRRLRLPVIRTCLDCAHMTRRGVGVCEHPNSFARPTPATAIPPSWCPLRVEVPK